MATALDSQLTAALRRAAIRATYAMSVHDTQPWHFDLHGGELTLLADPSRQLYVGDPARRQLTMSVGCALFNVRVALAAAGVSAQITRVPDPSRSTLLARVVATGRSHTVDPIADYDSIIEDRQTDRELADEPVPAAVVTGLVGVAAEEGAILLPVERADEHDAVVGLSRRANEIQLLDPAYRAELRAWSSAPPAEAAPSAKQCLLLLGTRQDDLPSWLRAGEALERVLLEVAKAGYAASPLTQVVEVASTRMALQSELSLTVEPHVLLRVGRAGVTPGTPRRLLTDVLEEQLDQ
jgi:hypothetical protein